MGSTGTNGATIVGMRIACTWCFVILVSGCVFPTPSKEFACKTDQDCDPERVCGDQQYCIIPTLDAAPSDSPVVDAAIAIDGAMIDAGPIVMTFNVTLTDCDGSKCKGGYDGMKQPAQGGTANATKLCADHTFPTAVDYTISTNTPGGRFCTYVPGSMTWGCDGSCCGCNPITTVTCSNP